MRKKKKSLGDWGENRGSEYLISQGFQIIKRNYHVKFAEIDIIAQKNQTIFFIEVKTRSSSLYGEGWEGVSKHKIQKIQKAAEIYMQLEKLDKDVCIAVLSILFTEGKWKIDFLPVEKY